MSQERRNTSQLVHVYDNSPCELGREHPDETVCEHGYKIKEVYEYESREWIVKTLRTARGLCPTVEGTQSTCGNFGCLGGGRGHEGCGVKVQAWSQAAWDIELLARRMKVASDE